MRFLTNIFSGGAAALVFACCSTDSIAADVRPPAPEFTHPREITNPCFPINSLVQDILTGKHERVERTARPELQKSISWQGRHIEAFVVEDREIVDGKLEEVAMDYFAQSDDGAVYYLGEDVDEYKDGKVSGHSGAWLLGKDTDTPGLLIPATPKVGDKFQSEYVPKVTTETDEVVSVSETVKVKAGKFKDCVKIKESLSDGTTEYKYYAKGIGVIKEVEPDGAVELESHKAKH
jgi:hypothetical protein